MTIRNLLDFAASMPGRSASPNEDLLRQLVAEHLQGMRAAFADQPVPGLAIFDSDLPEAAEILITRDVDQNWRFSPWKADMSVLAASLGRCLRRPQDDQLCVHKDFLWGSLRTSLGRTRWSGSWNHLWALLVDSMTYIMSGRDPAHDPYLPLLEIWGLGYWPLGLRNDGVFVVVVPL
jgi:hypothetical protein